jgi:glucokinase
MLFLQAFLDESEVRSSAASVQAAALAVAGAVENNRCPMTNISWVIDGKQLQQQFKFRVAVLNDFEAVGYGIPALESSDLVALNDVPQVPEAPKVVMGECKVQLAAGLWVCSTRSVGGSWM